MTSNGKIEGRIEREGRLRWVPLAQMRVNPLAQRDLNQARVAQLAAAFDPEQMGTPTVSHRGGWYYLIDGQHRIAALKCWLSSWEDQQVQCWTYEGLTEAAEAEKFLSLNDALPVRAFAKFKVSVQAGRDEDADVDRIVRALGLRIARGSGGISAVATLRRVYARGGPAVLSRALRIIRDAYGEAGLDGPVIDGIGLVCQRYDGDLSEQRAVERLSSAHGGEAGLDGPVIDGIGLVCQRYDGDLSEQRAVERLSSAHGGVSGLISRAGQLRQSTGSATAQCVAAAAVEVINRGSGGRKLPAWWRNASDSHQR
jgi:hypothetical protein